MESTNTEVNKEYFNKKAATYDSDRTFQKTYEQLTAAIKARINFIGADWAKEGDGRTVRLIDYACGSGNISRAFYPYVTQCRGIDLSPNMVAVYKARAVADNIPPERMDALEGNILDDNAPALQDPTLFDADVACVSLALHHMDDPALAVRRLAARLRPGGVLFVVDFLAKDHDEHNPKHHHHHHHHHHDGHHGSEKHGEHGAKADDAEVLDHKEALRTIAHHGFTPEQVRDMFSAAGVIDGFALEPVPSIKIPTMGHREEDNVVFFARGRRPEV